jgi:hypothetical protein
MRKVYIINKSSHDFSGAVKYGELIYLSEGPINRFATNKMYRLFADGMKKSNKEDYLLLSGLTVMAVIASVIFVAKHKCLNLLIFRANSFTYAERRLDLSDL